MSIYAPAMITKTLAIPIANVGKDVQQTLEVVLKSKVEGKCAVEGFIKPGSVTVLQHSSGNVDGSSIQFEVVFEIFLSCRRNDHTVYCPK